MRGAGLATALVLTVALAAPVQADPARWTDGLPADAKDAVGCAVTYKLQALTLYQREFRPSGMTDSELAQAVALADQRAERMRSVALALARPDQRRFTELALDLRLNMSGDIAADVVRRMGQVFTRALDDCQERGQRLIGADWPEPAQ